MMKHFRNLMFCAAIVIITSCETERDIKIGLFPPIAVLNSLMSNDSAWRVSLTKTVNVTGTSNFFLPVENAEISIFDSNNSLVEILLPSTDFRTQDQYIGSTIPVVGESYEVRAVLEDGTIITSRATVPENVPITSYKLDSTLFKSEGGRVQMNLSIKDPSDIANYYFIRIFRHAYFINGSDTIRFIENVGYELSDPALNEFSQTAVNDILFNGKPHDFDFKINEFGYQAITESFHVQLLNINKEYYQYLSTVDLQNSTQGDPFSQPTLIFSNIENGTGILGAFNASTITLQ